MTAREKIDTAVAYIGLVGAVADSAAAQHTKSEYLSACQYLSQILEEVVSHNLPNKV